MNGTSLDPNNQCKKQGIALSIDTDTRFKPPTGSLLWTGMGVSGSEDPYLAQGYYAFEAGHRIPIATDEDFVVWARPAVMPDFRKLYRIFTGDLASGQYLLNINELFDVTSFSGEKHVIIATTTWIGGSNYVLGILLVVMGCVSFALAVTAVVIVVWRGSRVGVEE